MLAGDRHQLLALPCADRIALKVNLDQRAGFDAEHQVHSRVTVDVSRKLGRSCLVVPLLAQLIRIAHQPPVERYAVVLVPDAQVQRIEQLGNRLPRRALNIDRRDTRARARSNRKHHRRVCRIARDVGTHDDLGDGDIRDRGKAFAALQRPDSFARATARRRAARRQFSEARFQKSPSHPQTRYGARDTRERGCRRGRPRCCQGLHPPVRPDTHQGRTGGPCSRALRSSSAAHPSASRLFRVALDPEAPRHLPGAGPQRPAFRCNR